MKFQIASCDLSRKVRYFSIFLTPDKVVDIVDGRGFRYNFDDLRGVGRAGSMYFLCWVENGHMIDCPGRIAGALVASACSSYYKREHFR